jgi:uncharacterized delta-60 repeat protein
LKKIIFYILISFNSLNAQVQQQWIQSYNGPFGYNDRVTAMTTDKSGNTYITGYTTSSNGYDFATIKYNSSGLRLWVTPFSGIPNGNDVPCCIATDDSGNVFVSGRSETISFRSDIKTIKYNSSGQQQWIVNWSGSAGNDDVPTGIFVDRSGFIYVTGYSFQFGSNYDYITIKYNPTGTYNWFNTFNGTGNSVDKASSIKVDNQGNVYVTGYTTVSPFEIDYATIKYNSFGIQQWVSRYDGSINGDDFAISLDLDQSGNVFVTGESNGLETCTDYATIKYNSAGSQIWVNRYNDLGSGCESPVCLKIDGDGNVIVTGSSYGADSQSGDFFTIKYSNAGVTLWENRYNSTEDYDDIVTSMAMDIFNNVYVTGYNEISLFRTHSITTVKYSSAGNQIWEQKFYSEPSGYSSDKSIGISLDSSDNVYIAGYNYNAGTSDDYFVIKYSQTVNILLNSQLIPEKFYISQNYPNPFNPTTNLEFGISNLGFVSLKIYDMQGKEVSTLVNENLNPGTYKYTFNSAGLSSGVYFYKLTSGNFSDIKRMILLK